MCMHMYLTEVGGVMKQASIVNIHSFWDEGGYLYMHTHTCIMLIWGKLTELIYFMHPMNM